MRALELIAASAVAMLTIAAPAQAEFGLTDLEVSLRDDKGVASPEAMQAGSHPFAMSTSLALNTVQEGAEEYVDGALRSIEVALPEGLTGNRTAVPYCSTLDFLAKGEGGGFGNCPDSAAIGVIDNVLGTQGTPSVIPTHAIYNLVPPPGVAVKLGFWVGSFVPITLELGLNPNPPYNAVAKLSNANQTVEVFASELSVWGNPADPVHDPQRGRCALSAAADSCSADISVEPFLVAPRSCTGPLPTLFKATSWWTGSADSPGPPTTFEGVALTENEFGAPAGMNGCGKLGFAPTIVAKPSTDRAESPSGMEVELEVDDENLLSPTGIAHSDIKSAEVILPEGLTANPSLAEGLATCSEADLARETLGSGPGEGCPGASKVGTVEAQTPVLEGKVLRGELFVATQDDPSTTTPGAENPFDSLLALYVVIRDTEIGAIIKLAGEIEPDPETGRLITRFGVPDAADPAYRTIPQQPISHFRVKLREGGRSPLITPGRCGAHTAVAKLTPWADPERVLTTTSTFQITAGPNGAPCPSGPPPFEPGFEAGSLNNQGGAFSPFHMRLTRRDGDQDLARFDATLPRGMIAKLAGVTQCGEAQIAAARARTSGREELASPSCPASSELGTVYGGAGVGSQLTYVRGSFYLAGPVNGAPLSVVAIVPAVAGPFDVGNVVVRQVLKVDPVTAEVKVDSAASDSLPTMLAGIPLKVRDVRVEVDRPIFTLNPTSCDPTAMTARLWGSGALPRDLADDAPVTRTARFQAAGCQSLGFKPKMALNLKGGTKRGQFPALTATYAPRPGDANLEGLALRLPRSAFLEQGHFRTICTRVQFAADACPPGAVYGQVTAHTPLLDEPLKGPIYLRSSSHDLPDIVFDLHGLVDVEAVARVDSHKGGIRATIKDVPDAPLSKVVVTMQGGKKGLIVNSRNLCAKPSRASAEASAQNGKRATLKPPVKAKGCKKKRASKQKSRGKRAKR